MKIFFDQKEISCLDDALDRIKDKQGYDSDEFESSTCSTVPLISLLKHGGKVWSSIVGEFAGNSCEAHLEYEVKPPQGNSKAPSHTDVMLIDGSRAIAIEAKWTEPRYEEVGEWLNKGSGPQNRRKVMNGWVSLLQKHTNKVLKIDDFSKTVYQMVHRAASACTFGNPAMAYLQFSPLPCGSPPDNGQLKNDLKNFYDLLGCPTGFPFFLIEVEAKEKPAFGRIKGLPKGSASTAKTVKNALRDGPLFDFTGYHLYRI
ncbi:MAG: hypothetical protein ABSC48_06370 [Terracidiphilus sp.]|jgi:hypothetical protein